MLTLKTLSFEPMGSPLPSPLFGTDGIRGPATGPALQPRLLRALGYILGQRIKKEAANTAPANFTVALGMDTRGSGPSLQAALVAGFAAAGVPCTGLGIVPTPAVAHWVRSTPGCQLGIAITASHNPAADNGVKLFTPTGEKFEVADEADIEAATLAAFHNPPAQLAGERASKADEGNTETSPQLMDAAEAARKRYTQYIQSQFEGLNLKGLHIVLDCANGATYQTTPAVLEALGAQLTLLGNTPNAQGTNINEGCGSEHPGALARAVEKSGAHLGLAHDGDGDRLVVVCGGAPIAGEILLGLFALHAGGPGAPLITTLQSNQGLVDSLKKAGIDTVRTPVGDRHVAHQLKVQAAAGSAVGGENSGHYIFPSVLPTGDGLVAALTLLRILTSEQQASSEHKSENRNGEGLLAVFQQLSQSIQLYPSASTSFYVKAKKELETLPTFSMAQRVVHKTLEASGGRSLVRYSGTELKLRLLVEATTQSVADTLLKQLTDAAQADLG